MNDGRPGAAHERGVSMIEIAVVLVVIALLMAVISPEISRWLRSLQIRRTADAIQVGLQRARTEAVRRNRQVTFWLVSTSTGGGLDNGCARSTAGTSWIVSVNDPGGQCGADVDDTIDPIILDKYVAGSSASNVIVAATQDDLATASNCVTFNGFGRIVDTAGCGVGHMGAIAIKGNVTDGDYRPLRIEISDAGNVRLCDTVVTSTSDPRKCQLQ